MILTCYIIDDQPPTVELLELYINLHPDLKLIGTDDRPEPALEKMATREINPDIIFLDIDMPGLSGLEVATFLKDKAHIIFVTGHRHYGPEAYSLNAVDYILKPFSYERLAQGVEKVKRIVSENRDIAYLFLHDAGKNEKVKLFKNDIQYIEALPNYTKVVTMDRQYLTTFKLKEAEKAIKGSSFIRVHKSYIVNIQKIHTITGYVIKMENGERIPIGRSYKEAFMKKISL